MNQGLAKANTQRDQTCLKCQKVLHCNVGAFKTHVRWCGIDYAPIFWSRVEKTDTCWLWTGALQRDGYGHFHRVKTISAHRYAYEQLVGPIPDGMDLLHTCDVRNCVRVGPGHLHLGTELDNVREMIARGRAAFQKPRALRKPRAPLLACRRGGHPWTPENTYLAPKGFRVCRTCRAERPQRAS